MLERFACIEVLRHRFKAPWWERPPEWQQPDTAKCRELLKGPDKEEADFVAFVQWLAERQLRSAKDLAHRLGMKVGLYLDEAVGEQADGFVAWFVLGAFSRCLSVGALPVLLF